MNAVLFPLENTPGTAPNGLVDNERGFDGALSHDGSTALPSEPGYPDSRPAAG